MLFSSITFLYAFLPILLALYFIVPKGWRNGVLLAASLLFYAWGEPVYISIMFASIAIDYTHGMLVTRCKERGNDKGARMAVASSVERTGQKVIWASCPAVRISPGRSTRLPSITVPVLLSGSPVLQIPLMGSSPPVKSSAEKE